MMSISLAEKRFTVVLREKVVQIVESMQHTSKISSLDSFMVSLSSHNAAWTFKGQSMGNFSLSYQRVCYGV